MTAGELPVAIHLAAAAMGTRFELVLHGADQGALRAAGESAIERIEDAHRTFTRFESSSLLAHLRRVAPATVSVDRDTMTLFADAREVARRSGGAFDPTRAGRWTDLRIDRPRQRLSLAHADVELDLGAIAKGHAIDLAVAALRDAGITSAFVHGGTSSGFGLGRPPGGTAWRVAWRGGSEIFDLVDQAYSVSSTEQTRSGAESRHVRDPRIRDWVPTPRRAAVVGPGARLADAWSTAALVQGRRPAAMGDEWKVWIS